MCWHVAARLSNCCVGRALGFFRHWSTQPLEARDARDAWYASVVHVLCASPLLLLLLQEGLAHLCLVGSSTTLVRAKIEANLPRKRGPAIAGYDKAWDKFMDQVGRAAQETAGASHSSCLCRC